MADISVFECGICLCRYNELEKLPLSLPCGHVYCKSCIKGFSSTEMTTCPIDKQVHKVPADKLPCCYAILVNLPSPTPRAVTCTRHSRKKLKFMCKFHTVYLCSECVIDHTGPGHEIAPFIPNIDQMQKELGGLAEYSADIAKKAKGSLQTHSQAYKKLGSHYEGQIVKVKTCFDSAIRMLASKKKEHIEFLMNCMKDQQVGMDMYRKKHTKMLETAANLAKEIEEYVARIYQSPYEELVEFISSKKNEIRAVVELRTNEIDTKFYIFNDNISIRDSGSMVLMKSTKEEKDCGCYGNTHSENCLLKKCRTCNSPLQGKACLHCKSTPRQDFSASQNSEGAKGERAPVKKVSPPTRKATQHPKHSKQRIQRSNSKSNNSF